MKLSWRWRVQLISLLKQEQRDVVDNIKLTLFSWARIALLEAVGLQLTALREGLEDEFNAWSCSSS